MRRTANDRGDGSNHTNIRGADWRQDGEMSACLKCERIDNADEAKQRRRNRTRPYKNETVALNGRANDQALVDGKRADHGTSEGQLQIISAQGERSNSEKHRRGVPVALRQTNDESA